MLYVVCCKLYSAESDVYIRNGRSVGGHNRVLRYLESRTDRHLKLPGGAEGGALS